MATSGTSGTATLVVSAAPPVTEPEGRFCLAFDSPTLDPNPVWERLDSIPNLVTSYTIDRGRQYELDRTDTGRATVQIIDPDGILDPTNADGPYFGKIQPLLQAAIGRYNPVADVWQTRYRGFVEDFAYDIDPTQRLNRLTITLVDLFEILTACELQPGQFGDRPPAESVGMVYYDDQNFHDRIAAVLTNVGLTRRYWVVFPGTTNLHEAVYSPGETALSVIQEAADGEFPGVANTYCDRKGRLVCPDRRSRFDPEATSAEVGADKWDYHLWEAGDADAINLAPGVTVQLRELSFSRSLAKIINTASATPVDIADEAVQGQLVYDATSIGERGIRSWSAESLLTKGTIVGGTDGLTLCRQFATHYVTNYKEPRDRITSIGFRPLAPTDDRAPALWDFLNTVDINDSIRVNADAAPLNLGGGFHGEEYFVEGIHEEGRPLHPDYDDVTMHLDLSPRAYYTESPFD